jgi:hypothetical protein
MGGLGNQLFQYAFVEKLKSMGKDVKVDLSVYEDTPEGTTVRDSIYDMLNTKYEIATQEEIDSLFKRDIWSKIWRRISKNANAYYENEPSYKPEILKRTSGYLVGYWQSEKYFKDMRSRIVEAFDFSEMMKDGDAAILDDQESDTESVALHIRGGDYLNNLNAGTFGGICTKEYYCKAIEYIAQKIKNPKFYIFTNDKEYAKKIVNAVLDSTGESINYQFVEGNDESHAYIDLVLMSKCKHHILANSSFSWWGEYLSDQSGITIAPSKWTNDSDNKDIYRENWVVMQ